MDLPALGNNHHSVTPATADISDTAGPSSKAGKTETHCPGRSAFPSHARNWNTSQSLDSGQYVERDLLPALSNLPNRPHASRTSSLASTALNQLARLRQQS